MSLLLPEIGLIFWMTLSFMVVFFLLTKFGFPVITRAVDKRSKYIDDSLESARKAEERIASLNEEAAAILAEAEKERNKILAETQQMKDTILEEVRQTAREEAKQRADMVSAEIDEMKKRALQDIRSEVAAISVKIAEKLIIQKIGEGEQQKMLIDRMLDEQTDYKS